MGNINKEQTFLSDILAGRESNNVPEYVSAVRNAGAVEVDKLPIPTQKHEEWKYTNLKPLLKNNYVSAQKVKGAGDVGDVSEHVFAESENQYLTFVNGVYRKDLSTIEGLPKDVVIGNIADVDVTHQGHIAEHLGKHAQYEDDPFTPFNSANFRDGAFVYIPKETRVANPVQLLFITTDADEAFFTTPRVLIIGERHSEITIVEDYISLADNVYFNCPVTEVALAEGGKLTHVKLQRESKSAFHIGRIATSIKKDSEYHSYAVHLGSQLSRSDVKAVQLDENTHCTLDGLVLVKGNQVSDTHSVMDHAMPNCTSHQLHKCIVDDKAESIFNGKIFVRQDAQQTNAFQENRNLLLSNNGTVNTKPQLEIWADDVKCSHGATIGQLNEDQVFYLKSRGLSDHKSREILSYGFALDVIESIPVESIQKRLTVEVEKFTRSNSEVNNLVE
ncbi:MAG: Fe-S cluster assembly protein SufD [Balneolales bacterium]